MLENMTAEDVLKLMMDGLAKEIQDTEAVPMHAEDSSEQATSKTMGWFQNNKLPHPSAILDAFSAKEVIGMLKGQPPTDSGLSWVMGVQFGFFLRQEQERREANAK